MTSNGRTRALKKNGSGRIEQKAAIRGFNGVTDLARATFVIDSPQHALRAVQMVRKQFPTIDEGWQKTPVGYLDRKLLVRFPTGASAKFS